MEYYYFPTSHWSRAVSMVLSEKGLGPRRHFVDIRKNASFEPEYIQINPNGVVPTLVDQGQVVCNSLRIAEYLDENYPNPPLYQRHPEHARVREWTQRLEDVPVMLLSYSVWVLGKRGERSADILADKVARAERYQREHPALERQYRRKAEFFRDFRAQVYDDEHVAQCAGESQAVLDEITEQVRSQPWLCGDAFSFADCIAVSTLYRLRDLGKLDAWAKQVDHPLNEYMARLEARESYRHVFVDDDLIPS